MFLSSADLPTAPTVPFFRRLNEVLERAGLDAFAEGLCQPFHAARMGRPASAKPSGGSGPRPSSPPLGRSRPLAPTRCREQDQLVIHIVDIRRERVVGGDVSHHVTPEMQCRRRIVLGLARKGVGDVPVDRRIDAPLVLRSGYR